MEPQIGIPSSLVNEVQGFSLAVSQDEGFLGYAHSLGCFAGWPLVYWGLTSSCRHSCWELGACNCELPAYEELVTEVVRVGEMGPLMIIVGGQEEVGTDGYSEGSRGDVVRFCGRHDRELCDRCGGSVANIEALWLLCQHNCGASSVMFAAMSSALPRLTQLGWG